MSITTLPTPSFVSRQGGADVDSLGRFLLFDAVWQTGSTGVLSSTPNHLARYDPSTNSWTSLASAPFGHGVQFYPDLFAADKRYRFMGQNLDGGTQPITVDIWDSASNTWSTVTTPYTSGFGFEGAAWVSGGVLYAGGFNPLFDGTGALFWKLVSGSWVSVATYTPSDRVGFTNRPFISSAGKVYCAAVSGLGSSVPVYDPAANSWSTISWAGNTSNFGRVAMGADQFWSYGVSASHLSRYDIATGTTSSAFAVCPGASDGTLNYDPSTNALFMFPTNGTDIYQYDIATDTWTDTGDAPTARTLQVSPVFDGTGFYIPTGHDALNHPVNVVEYFVPAGVSPPPATGGWSFAAVIGD